MRREVGVWADLRLKALLHERVSRLEWRDLMPQRGRGCSLHTLSG